MGASDIVAVKVGYWVKMGSGFHSRKYNFVASYRGLRAFAIATVVRFIQAFEIISVCMCFGRMFYRYWCAIKCTKVQAKEGVRGGKIGVLPRDHFLKFRQAKELVASLFSLNLNNKANSKLRRMKGFIAAFVRSWGALSEHKRTDQDGQRGPAKTSSRVLASGYRSRRAGTSKKAH